MITTYTGKHKNVGDYLISHRAHNLLKHFIDPDLVDLNRFDLPENMYDVINNSDALFLCGGPAYRDAVYPKIYNLDLDKIHVPVIPYGVGWKADIKVQPEDFSFTPESLGFIKRIHANIPRSSVRDFLTEKVIHLAGIDNVIMTGCPATYDLEFKDTAFSFKDEPESILVSGPAKADKYTLDLIKYIGTRFPKAQKKLALHHGYFPRYNRSGLEMGRRNAGLAATAAMNGFKIVNLSSDLPKMFEIYDRTDLHIGYRVHGHLYCTSKRIPSFLICEDVRGTGQLTTLGMPAILSDDGTIDRIGVLLEEYFARKGEMHNAYLPRLNEMWGVMENFLHETKDFINHTAAQQNRKSARS